jgi:hypothetical protein
LPRVGSSVSVAAPSFFVCVLDLEAKCEVTELPLSLEIGRLSGDGDPRNHSYVHGVVPRLLYTVLVQLLYY